MACCLTAPSHYLNQCWLNISKVQWHPSESNFTRVTEISLKITYLKFHSNLPGVNELIKENAFVIESVVCKMLAILFWPQWVNQEQRWHHVIHGQYKGRPHCQGKCSFMFARRQFLPLNVVILSRSDVHIFSLRLPQLKCHFHRSPDWLGWKSHPLEKRN